MDPVVAKQSAVAPIDWRSKFEKSPTVFLAAALGGGLLMGSATNHRKSRSRAQTRRDFEATPAHRSLGWDWNDSIGVVRNVLIGIAITQAKKMLFEPPQQPKVPPDSATH
jgi:surface antigen